MKVVILKDDLVNILRKFLTIITLKPAIPILENILLEAIDDQLILTATDITTSMKCFCDAKVIESGAITLPARKLFRLTKELISPQVKISLKENNIAEIISGSSIFKINGIDKNEFPNVSDVLDSFQINFSSNELKELLYRSSFSAARNDSEKLILNGINIKIKNNIIGFFATNGKRLSIMHFKINIDPFFQGTYNIPLKAVEEMIKILDDPGKDAILGLMPNKISLESNNQILTTNLISGNYPNIEKVVPKKIPHYIALHREDMISILKQISIFTKDTTSSIQFIFQKEKLNITSNKQGLGEGQVSLTIDYQGEEIVIAFNPFYFLDILMHSKDETVKIGIIDSHNPGVIIDSTNATFVMMPMKLNDTKKDPANDIKEPAFT